jgi:hypothetical protein
MHGRARWSCGTGTVSYPGLKVESIKEGDARTNNRVALLEPEMSAGDVEQRLVNEIRLRAYDDHYIDRTEEREILQIAVAVGVELDPARQALARVCLEQGYVLESDVVASIKSAVEAAAREKKIDRTAFEGLVDRAKFASGGKRGDREARRLVIAAMEETGHTRVKTGWFSDWYASAKRELGVS